MKKQKVIALKLHRGNILVGDVKTKMELPDGCLGMCFAFESEEKAKEFWGDDVSLMGFEVDKDKL